METIGVAVGIIQNDRIIGICEAHDCWLQFSFILAAYALPRAASFVLFPRARAK
jgi:hypothetical protein